MSEEIKVGEYVRTENGFIGKLIESENGYLNYKFKRITVCKTSLERGDTAGKTVKHSKNIIELIEKNDWVNGQHVKEVKNGYVIVGNGLDGFQVWEENIRTIVTKEQFKSVEYEVN